MTITEFLEQLEVHSGNFDWEILAGTREIIGYNLGERAPVYTPITALCLEKTSHFYDCLLAEGLASDELGLSEDDTYCLILACADRGEPMLRAAILYALHIEELS